MKCFSWNVNGIRAVERKGALQEFIEKYTPDVLMLQEIKAQIEKLSSDLTSPRGYTAFYLCAKKPGYSGVSIWIKDTFEAKSISGMKGWVDDEGRVLRVDVGEYSFVNVYVPNGGKSDNAYKEKFKFLTLLGKYFHTLELNKRICILGGDFNVARSDIDVDDPDRHRNNTCFRADIKEHFGKILDEGLVDVYRKKYPKRLGAYTWWQNFDLTLPKGIKPRELNKGFRLDYFFCSHKQIEKIKKVEILQEVFGSDHCPIYIELD